MVTRAAAVVLLLFSLLPLANLIPGGEVDAEYAARISDWGLGFALCAGVGGLFWFLARRHPPTPAVSAFSSGLTHPREWRVALLISAVAFLVYCAIALFIFSGRPLLIDEIVQVLQAYDLAEGRLTHPVQLPREFYSILHVVDLGADAYGQYPFGGPALLVPGIIIGATWLVGPVIGALCVFLFWVLLGRTDPLASTGWRRTTTAVFAFAPWGAFMFGSHMNHAAVLLWLLVALVCLAEATRDDRSPLWGLGTGLALGLAATVRPIDAALFALPAGAWLLVRAPRGRSAVLSLLWSGVGIAIPLGLLLIANQQTTGHPFTFAYEVLWGDSVSFGFHAAPWGPPHTPARGLELVSLYLTRLNTHLFETPFPALLVPAVGLWFAGRLQRLDWFLLVTTALILVGYWSYWHDGYYLGPRFLFPLLPALIIWSARAVPSLRDRLGAGSAAWRGVRAFAVAGVVYALVTIALVRAPSYRNGLTSMRVDSEGAALAAGVRNAVVLVQESWGAQLMVRLWAREISRSDSETLYRGVDTCVLEVSLARLEREGVSGDSARALLFPLLADSALLVPTTLSPDHTQRMRPGLRYPALCENLAAADRGGYLLFAPWRLARDSNHYARWIPGREAQVAASFPGRPVYRVRRDGNTVGAPLVWERLEALPTSEDTPVRASLR